MPPPRPPRQLHANAIKVHTKCRVSGHISGHSKSSSATHAIGPGNRERRMPTLSENVRRRMSSRRAKRHQLIKP